MRDKDKALSTHEFIKRSAPRGAIISALGGCPIRSWLIGAILVIIGMAAFLMVLPTLPVSAAPEEKASLDCLSCHTRVLVGHDKLGSGSQACWVCHDSTNIGTLRLFDGTQLPLSGSPQVCGQCHTQRYQAWNEERHGILPLGVDGAGLLVMGKGRCIVCHDPHQPKIDLTKLAIPSLPTFEPGAPLDCLSCHARILKGHDKLGEGSEACRACHSSTQMGVLHLAGGETLLPLAESPKLCAQCHQKRYEEWTQGTHGMPSWEEGIVEVHGIQKVGCISCHDPHQPQVALLNITKPHPESVPAPPAPPTQLLMILGISLVVIIGLGIVLIRQGGRP